MSSDISTRSFELTPLPASFGAEIEALDLSVPLSDAVFADVVAAWHEFSLLIFRDQELTPEQHIAFSSRFGELERHVQKRFQLPGYADIFVVSNYMVAGRECGGRNCALVWHSDHAYHPRPSMGSVFYAVRVPETGGETLFATMYAAYEDLAPAMQQRLVGMKSVYDYAHLQRLLDRPLPPERAKLVPPVAHPIVRTHPDTKRKSLFIGGAIVSHAMTADGKNAGDTLVPELLEHATQAKYVYRHRYRKGDLIFWDNRCLLHRGADYDDSTNTRIMHRTTILGDRPV